MIAKLSWLNLKIGREQLQCLTQTYLDIIFLFLHNREGLFIFRQVVVKVFLPVLDHWVNGVGSHDLLHLAAYVLAIVGTDKPVQVCAMCAVEQLHTLACASCQGTIEAHLHHSVPVDGHFAATGTPCALSSDSAWPIFEDKVGVWQSQFTCHFQHADTLGLVHQEPHHMWLFTLISTRRLINMAWHCMVLSHCAWMCLKPNVSLRIKCYL